MRRPLAVVALVAAFTSTVVCSQAQNPSPRLEPNGIEGWSLRAEPAKVTGSQICWKGAAEHRSLALGLLLGCFILNDVPMLH